MLKGLGRVAPPDWEHYEKFPLTAGILTTNAPLVWGVNWYEAFGKPRRDSNGEWWIAKDGKLGELEGGHCIAQPYVGARDLQSWYEFYDQGTEGACVGYGWSRVMSWLNRRKYDAYWLYKEAQKVDEWRGENYEGTSVRAGAKILMDVGHRRVYNGQTLGVQEEHGIAAYRWINSVDQALEIVGGEAKRRGAITWRNSWGIYYPQKVWLPAEVAQRLINEDGEVAVVTDK